MKSRSFFFLLLLLACWLGSPEKNPAMWMALAYAMAKMENGSHAFIDPVPMLQGWRLLFKVDKDDEDTSVDHDDNL